MPSPDLGAWDALYVVRSETPQVRDRVRSVALHPTVNSTYPRIGREPLLGRHPQEKFPEKLIAIDNAL